MTVVKKISIVASALALMAGAMTAFGATDKEKVAERLSDGSSVLTQIMATPDKAIPGGILRGASCVVVIPSFKKAAFVVGAEYGQGVATCRTPRGWSAPVFVQLTGGSFGFQDGGQAADL